MARIDRRRLDGAAFPVTLALQTRFDDVDVQGHVNNVAAAVFLQEARVNLNARARLADLAGGARPVVAAISIEYAGEMHHPEPIEIDSGVLALGRTSVTIGQRARQGGRTTLYAETVLVMAGENGAAAIPDPLRAAYESLMLHPR